MVTLIHDLVIDVVGRITIVKGDSEASACALNAIYYFLAFVCINGHRLLGNDVTAHLHCLYNILMVSAVDGGDDNYVGLRFLNHFFKFMGHIGGQLFISKLPFKNLVCIVESRLVDIAESYKLGGFGIGFCNSVVIHSCSATKANLCISLFSHYIILFNVVFWYFSKIIVVFL